MDQVKSSSYLELAHDLEIDKAIGFLKKKDFQEVWRFVLAFYSCRDKSGMEIGSECFWNLVLSSCQAIETLKSFEKKDTKVACTAATNLSFLYFLVSDLGLFVSMSWIVLPSFDICLQKWVYERNVAMP